MVTMQTETGTRIMIRAMQDKTAPKVDELPLDTLVLRDTVVLKAYCEPEHGLTAEEIDNAFKGADFRKGDSVIISTGWGDGEKWYELGDDYARRTPCFSKEGAIRLVEIMKENESDLVGSDVSTFGQGHKYQLPEWSSKPAWERPPFPSYQAKRYLASYTKEKAYADFESPHVLNNADMMYIGAMCNIGEISKPRGKLIVLPMKIKGAREASCRVVAVEEQEKVLFL
ncbi:cyclase family protein [Thermodesulfobacteriota bacterium]